MMNKLQFLVSCHSFEEMLQRMCSVAYACLRFAKFLPQPPECWSCGYMLPHPASKICSYIQICVWCRQAHACAVLVPILCRPEQNTRCPLLPSALKGRVFTNPRILFMQVQPCLLWVLEIILTWVLMSAKASALLH